VRGPTAGPAFEAWGADALEMVALHVARNAAPVASLTVSSRRPAKQGSPPAARLREPSRSPPAAAALFFARSGNRRSRKGCAGL
jgi:hypothetical protein